MNSENEMPEDACIFRVSRLIDDDTIRFYGAIRFTGDNPAGACMMYLRRCEIFGGIAKSKDEMAGACDIENLEGDIVEDFGLNRKGLRYLYKALKLRVEK